MLFPWVGHLEQVRLADVYVHYTDVQFSKGSLVNRVQIKTAAGPKWLTAPLSKLRMGQSISEVRVDPDPSWKRRHIEWLQQCYATAPYASDMLAIVRNVYGRSDEMLADLSKFSLASLCEYFGLALGRQFMSIEELAVSGRNSDRVLDIVKTLGGSRYVTGHGARNYLDHQAFDKAGVRVEYMHYRKVPYRQLHGAFNPFVSALDLVANEGPAGVGYIQSTSVYWKDFLNER